MKKLKLYSKGKLGAMFYLGILLIALMIWQSVNLLISEKYFQMSFDIALIILLSMIVYRGYRDRNKLKEQEVIVEKYEEIHSPTVD